jgi:hypothetical protein
VHFTSACGSAADHGDVLFPRRSFRLVQLAAPPQPRSDWRSPTNRRYLAAGLIDEMEIHLVPLRFGGGARLIDNLAGSGLNLELVARSPERASRLKYRVSKAG